METPRGFSLLELVVVLSLASILVAVGVIGHQALRPQLSLRQAASQLVMDLKLARTHAVTDHVNHRLVFADGSATYRAQHKTGDGYTDDGAPIPLPKDIIIAGCTANDRAITFVPRGSAGSFGTITIRNGRGDVRHVSVNIAGQVRVY